jgi:hypothetical protein
MFPQPDQARKRFLPCRGSGTGRSVKAALLTIPATVRTAAIRAQISGTVVILTALSRSLASWSSTNW